MWESIISIIKVFSDKYLIPSVIAVVAAIGIVIALPGDYWMINKVGHFAFGVMIAGAFFLFVLLIIQVYKGICKSIRRRENERQNEITNQEQADRLLQNYWSCVDQFTPNEKKTLRELIISGNQPIEGNVYSFYSSDSLLYSKWIRSTVISDEKHHSVKHIYKLKDEIYELFKYSLEKYGRISNFD